MLFLPCSTALTPSTPGSLPTVPADTLTLPARGGSILSLHSGWQWEEDKLGNLGGSSSSTACLLWTPGQVSLPLRLSDLHPGKGGANTAQGTFEVKGYPAWEIHGTGPGIDSALSIHVLTPGWQKFDAILTHSSPGSFKLQGPFPSSLPPSHVLSCLPAPTHKYLTALSTHSLSSLTLALLDQIQCWPPGLQRCLSPGPCPGCRNLDEEMSLYI